VNEIRRLPKGDVEFSLVANPWTHRYRKDAISRPIEVAVSLAKWGIAELSVSTKDTQAVRVYTPVHTSSSTTL
jgi:hypothetical protein